MKVIETDFVPVDKEIEETPEETRKDIRYRAITSYLHDVQNANKYLRRRLRLAYHVSYFLACLSFALIIFIVVR